MNTRKDPLKLVEMAESLVQFGRKSGADEIEISIVDGTEFSVDVRQGNLENLVEAGSRYMGLKVIKDKKTAFTTSSDLCPETLRHLVKNAIRRARLASADKFCGLPPLSPVTTDIASLNMYDPEIQEFDSKTKIRLALETENIALQDRRISNSHSASCVTHESKIVLASSNGFIGEYDRTYCSLSVGLQAGETDHRVEDFWFSSKIHFRDLEPPEAIAKKAVERTVRQMNPRKIPTQKVPVIFEPMMTAWLLGFLFSCVSGVAVYQKATFLAGRLGQRIGNETITIVDDGLMSGKLGSCPFDSEGVPTRKTVVVEKGILKNFLCNTYAARKLKLCATGNAEGNGVGPNNFYLESGAHSPEEIIASCDHALLLTRTLGHGLNPITGDISRGAFGLWIEKGEITFPVSDITISGNLGEILNNIELIGNDLDFQSPVCGPTIKVRELTVAGE
ncbi:MAG: TldD/PmbA family protein [Candidatus Aminicenantales bacterium]